MVCHTFLCIEVPTDEDLASGYVKQVYPREIVGRDSATLGAHLGNAHSVRFLFDTESA